MTKPLTNPRIADFILQLEEQYHKKKSESKQLLQEEKNKLSRSCQLINCQKKASWSSHLHKRQLFNSPSFNPYQFVPKHKQEQSIFPNRVLEKGSKRLKVKMQDTATTSFPFSQSGAFRKVLKTEEKQKVIENRKLMELNRILEACDGNVRVKRLKKQSVHKFVTETGKSGYFTKYPGFINEQRIPQTELNKKISLARNTQSRWTVDPRQQLSKSSKSQTLSNFLLTKPQDTMADFI